MKIAGCSTHAVRVQYEDAAPGVHVVLRLRTDDGIEGVSYVSRLNPATIKPVASLIESRVEQLRDEEVINSEAVYGRLYRQQAFGPVVGLEARAASAIEVALWDIRGKALGLPLHRLLGGFRDRVAVSANWGVQHGPDAETLSAAARRHLQRGYRAMKFQLGQLDLPSAVNHIRTIREAVGPDVKLIVDANQNWSVKQALAMAEAIAPYDPYWIEDPVVHHDYAGLRQVKESVRTLVCAGEVYQTIPQFKRLFEERASDIAMVDLDLGISGFLRVAHMAEAHGVPLVNHLASELLAPAIAAVPNGLIVGFYPWAQPLFKEPARIEDGQLVLSDKPGLGLELDEDALKRFALT
jgi:L-alanine-DL-glutamate epimerase-like enolase superfamily enzyme